MLDDPNPVERSRAAWRFIENPLPDIETRMTGGLLGDEQDAGVRESFAWGLGKIGHTRNAGVMRHVIDLDESGEVRTAAWLALALLDKDAFVKAVAEKAPLTDWDEFAVARAKLNTGDLSEYRTVLRYARDGNDGQRAIASYSLVFHFRKYLDSIGQWPIDVTSTPGERLSAADIAKIEQRCKPLDLAFVTAEVLKHAAAGEEIKHTIRRLTGGRERIAKLVGVATPETPQYREGPTP